MTWSEYLELDTLVRSWRMGEGTPNWVLYRECYFKRTKNEDVFLSCDRRFLFYLSTRQSSSVYILKMEWLGNRKNCLFSLSWLLDKRESGKIAPSLRVSPQIYPGVGALQASTLEWGRKSWTAEKSREQTQTQVSQAMERKGLFPGTQRNLCGAQEADVAHQNDAVLWANLRERSPCTAGRQNSCQIPLFLFKLTWRSYFSTL